MAKTALAVLESALRDKKLDRTLITALPPMEQADDACAPTGVAAVDACLRNGVPRGHLSELAGPRSAGCTTLLLQMLAAATRRGELVALVDTFDRLDVASLHAAGADLGRVLWIRGQAGGPMDWAIDRALKGLNLVLQAGGFGLVAIDLADAPARMLRGIPFTTWLRVQRAVEGRDTACVLVAPEPVSRSAGGLTLTLTGRTAWTGSTARPRVAGAELRMRVVSPRRRVDGEAALSAAAEAPSYVAAGLPTHVAAGL
jgi:recombination protein RecA